MFAFKVGGKVIGCTSSGHSNGPIVYTVDPKSFRGRVKKGQSIRLIFYEK
jgi:hypothetical protein